MRSFYITGAQFTDLPEHAEHHTRQVGLTAMMAVELSGRAEAAR